MNLIKSITLMLLISVLTLKTVDLTFSFFFPQDNLIENGEKRQVVLREHNPGIRTSLTPDEDYLRYTETLDKKIYSLNVDENGFIDNGNESQVSDTDTLILFLGGSTTEALYVPEKKRFTSIVERELSSKLRQKVITLNGGKSGNHSIHSLINFIAKGLPQKPDFVVLMNNMNDLGSLRSTGSYWDAPKSRRIIQTEEKKPAWYLLAKSMKDLLAPNLYSYLLPRLKQGVTDEWRDYRDDYRSYSDFYKDYKASLLSFVSVAKAWDVKPVLMTQFNRVNLSDKLFRETFLQHTNNNERELQNYVSSYKKFNQIKRDIAKTEGVLLIDLDALVPSNSKYIYDTIHLNEVGSEYVGIIISDFFEKEIKRSLNKAN